VRAIRVAILCLAAAGPAAAQTRPANAYYYGLPYGSQSVISPLTTILNSAYYTFQIDNRGDDPFALPYGTGFDNVMDNLLHPFRAIGDYGWGRFLTSEVFPNPSRKNAQWVPNYVGHIIGEGLVYRYELEWYRYYGVPHPQAMALLTFWAGALINEAVENGGYQGANVDPIADTYIFNPIALVLFSSDRASRFLARKLGLAYWPYQPAYDPVSHTLQNTGYRTVFRVHPARSRYGIFASYGTQGLAGLSYKLSWRDRLTVAGGVAATELHEVQDSTDARQVSVTMGPAAAIFFDRNNSLLASLSVTPDKLDRATLNVYPGVLGPRWLRPGFTLEWNANDGLRFALFLRMIPVGFAGHTGRPEAKPQ
jgi:hypothetical protein